MNNFYANFLSYYLYFIFGGEYFGNILNVTTPKRDVLLEKIYEAGIREEEVENEEDEEKE